MTSYIIGTSFGSLALLIALIIIIRIFFKRRTKQKLILEIGARAEVKVNSDIKIWTKQTKNIFIDSSIYKYDHDMLFKVDSIIITSKAMIVVEVKSLNGSISGDCNAHTWKKTLNSNTFRIINAQSQNQEHIDHIIKMLNIKVPIISLIVFSNRTYELNIDNIPSHALIIRHVELFETLDNIDSSLPFSIHEKEMKYIKNQLLSKQTKSWDDIKKYESLAQIEKGSK